MAVALGPLTLRTPRLLVLVAVVLGCFSIGLGGAALGTHHWLRVTNTAAPNGVLYGLYKCDVGFCIDTNKFRTVQAIITAGVGAILVGVILTILLDVFTENRWIQLLSQIFSYSGPALILIGLLFYAKYVFEDVSPDPSGTLKLEYSIIFIVVSCLAGFLAAILSAFAAGLGRNHGIGQPSKALINRTQRF